MPPTSRLPPIFRRLTTGVYAIGVAHHGRANMFTAAWLTQVSFDPLLVALTLNRDNFSYPLLRESGVFAVNVLKKNQLQLARHFGTQSARDVDKLSGQRWRPGTLGAPILLDAAAYVECRVMRTVPAGDHELVLGRVTHGELFDSDAAVMVYADTDDMDGSSALFPETF